MPGLERRRLLRMFGVLAAAGAAGACGSSSLAEEATEQVSGRRIKLGLLYPLDGPAKAIGEDLRNGFQVFLDTNGGRLGTHDVELLTVDEGTTPEAAKAAAEQLVSQNVIAIVGGATSPAVTAIREVVEKAHVPFVGTNGSPSDLTSVYYMWRLSYVDGEAGRAMAPRFYREAKSAYVICDDTPATRDEAGTFRSAYRQAGGLVVADVVATDGFAERLRVAQASNAAGIFAAYSGTAAAEFLQAYRTAGIRKPLFGPGSLTEGADPAKLAEGVLPPKIYTAMNYAMNLDNVENRQFIVAYTRAAGRQPTAYAMAAYDAASVIDYALRGVGDDLSAVALNGGFSKLGQISSPRGLWAFTINRTPQQRWYLRRLRRDGQVPVNLAEEDLDLTT